jgi:hypothetical protein
MDNKITVSIHALARRVRSDLLRTKATDWTDEVIGDVRPDQLDEPAIVASYVIVGALARDRGKLRVARRAFMLADLRLSMSAEFGKYRRKPELAEQMPVWWREAFVPIVRKKSEYESLVREGDHYIRIEGGRYELRRRAHQRSAA